MRILKLGGTQNARILKLGGTQNARILKLGGTQNERILKLGGIQNARILKLGGNQNTRILKLGGTQNARILKSGGTQNAGGGEAKNWRDTKGILKIQEYLNDCWQLVVARLVSRSLHAFGVVSRVTVFTLQQM